MMAHTVQGYFVLKQQFLENQPGPWRIIAEVETEDYGPGVFDELSESLQKRYSKNP